MSYENCWGILLCQLCNVFVCICNDTALVLFNTILTPKFISEKKISEELIFAPNQQAALYLWVLLCSELLASPYSPSEVVCPPSFIIPFTVNELCSPSAVPPSFLSSPTHLSPPKKKLCESPFYPNAALFALFSFLSHVISLPFTPSLLLLLAICLTLSIWRWSASNPDTEACLIGMIVHLFHHLPQRTHYLKHRKTPSPAAITTLRIWPTMSCVSTAWACCVCVCMCGHQIGSYQRSPWRRHDSETETHKSACPWTRSSLSLVNLFPSFISPFLHPSIPPPPTPLRGGWGSSDAVTPGFPLSFCYSLFAESSFISHLLSQPF